MSEVNIHIVSNGEIEKTISVPVDMGLSLMEVLKAEDYSIEALCGGIALCATCHIQIQDDFELPKPSIDEINMLSDLPDYKKNSRLSCQLKISKELNNLKITFPK